MTPSASAMLEDFAWYYAKCRQELVYSERGFCSLAPVPDDGLPVGWCAMSPEALMKAKGDKS